ncbi:ATP-binding cassette domain-containing protein, partial [Paenibacillus odorifer]
MEIYRIEELSFTFPEQEQAALSNINLTIESGDFITICGKSGCGKSTLLR